MTLKRIKIIAEHMRTTLDGSDASYIQQRLPEGLDIVLGRRGRTRFVMFWRRDMHLNNEAAETIAEAFGVPMGTEPDCFESKDLGGRAFVTRYSWTEEPVVA